MKLRRILLLGMLGFSLALSAENKKIGYVQVSPDSSLADAVRKAREMRRLRQADSVVVKMQAGQYRLYEPLVLRPEDSHLCFEGTPSVNALRQVRYLQEPYLLPMEETGQIFGG